MAADLPEGAPIGLRLSNGVLRGADALLAATKRIHAFGNPVATNSFAQALRSLLAVIHAAIPRLLLLIAFVYYAVRLRALRKADPVPKARRAAVKLLTLKFGLAAACILTGWFGFAAVGIILVLVADRHPWLSKINAVDPLAEGARDLYALYMREQKIFQAGLNLRGYERYFPTDPAVRRLRKDAEVILNGSSNQFARTTMKVAFLGLGVQLITDPDLWASDYWAASFAFAAIGGSFIFQMLAIFVTVLGLGQLLVGVLVHQQTKFELEWPAYRSLA